MYRFMVLIVLGSITFAQTPAAPGGSDTHSPATSSPATVLTSPASGTNAASSAGDIASPKSDNAQREREDKDSLFDLPPLPERQKVSMIGGRVVNIDRVLDRMEIQAFGGKRMLLAFDVRTQVYRDGVKIAAKDIRPGDRVYADTLLDGSRRVFAKNIRVVTQLKQTESGNGQVVSYDAGHGTLIMRDELLPEPLKVHLTPDTVIRKGRGPGSINDLQPGSLVGVSFTPGGEGIVQQISVLAVPGASFVFSGPVTHLDLSSHLLAVADTTDGKTYDIEFDPARVGFHKELHEGSEVTVNAVFNGKSYVAQSLSVNTSSSQP